MPPLRKVAGRLVRSNPLTRDAFVLLKRRGVQRSPHVNLYHCCTQKTASQWFRRIFSSDLFFRSTGLLMVPYRGIDDGAGGVGLNRARITEAFPKHTMVTHLYVDHPTYAAIPKPGSHKSFFVMRDPRDIVVSWYFHALSPTTAQLGPIPDMRRRLVGESFDEGMRYVIDTVIGFGTVDAQMSWLRATPDPAVAIFRYEDLAADNRAFLARLFAHLDIGMPDGDFDRLVDRFAFHRLSGGRTAGEEDPQSHYRKGVPGDWRNYFDADLERYFRAAAGDALDILGYASRPEVSRPIR